MKGRDNERQVELGRKTARCRGLIGYKCEVEQGGAAERGWRKREIEKVKKK